MEIQYILALIFLFVISIIDIKLEEVPSMITYAFIIMSLFVMGSAGLLGGIIILTVGFLLMETPSIKNAFFSGGADLKCFVALGILMPDKLTMIYFIGLTVIAGTVYKLIVKSIWKKKKTIAFTPIFLISFGSMLIGGLL